MKITKYSLCLLLATAFGGCSMKSKYPITDHYNGSQFYIEGLDSDKSFWSVIKWSFSRPDGNYPEWIENKTKPQLPAKLEDGKVAATFVNHATFLLQTKDFNFLTEPVWSKRTSPVSFLGPKRFRDPGVKFEELPQINFVVISHNHYDHMDLKTIEDLHKKFKPTFIVGLGNAKHFSDIEGIQAVELDWWQSHTINNNGVSAKITMVPVQHWSSRSLTDKRESLWGGYVIEANQKSIFFSGDSGYSKTMFSKIGETWSGIDLALLPIGAYEPRWFMKINHMNPEEAVQVHLDIKSKMSVAMHYGTFQLSDELYGQPEKDLEEAKKKLSVENFMTLDVGETKLF
jgi:L-ascorbate metabolism protein UlaG (beta-lactamase superfamily)